MNPELFFAFLALTFVLVITPGPIVTLVIAAGATEGIRAAFATVAGTVLGNALLVGAIAFGLTWILNSSAMLFEIIRWLGAAYLVWLGVEMWRNAGRHATSASMPRGVHFGRGFFVALSNPKTVAFFTAFLPQFVDPTLPADFQLAVMSTVSVLMGAVGDSAWASASSLGRAWFARSSRAAWLRRFSGVVLVGGGIWLCLSRRPA
jgi:threonine/homoserine/homoserine lactone efflux protein